MSVNGLLIGDLHLGKSNLCAMFDDVDLLILNAVERVLRQALKQGTKLVVFLGDICDTQVMNERTRSAFLRLLHKYDGKLDIRIILGNHDVAESAVHSMHTFEALSDLRMLKTVRVFTKHETEVYGGVTLEYMPWPAEQPRERRSVCFAHFETAGATGDNGRKMKHGNDRSFDLENQFIQGHLHTEHSNRNHWYVGTMAQKSFGERLPKGYGEFKARLNGGKLVFRKRHVQWQPPWVLENVVLESKEDLRGYDKRIAALVNPRVKLFVGDGVKVGEDFLMKHPEIVNRLDFSSSQELEQLQAEELELETQSVALSHEDVLPLQLKRLGATRQQIKRARELVDARSAR